MGIKIEGKYRVHSTTKLVGAVGRVRTKHSRTAEEALAANAEVRLRQPGGDKQVCLCWGASSGYRISQVSILHSSSSVGEMRADPAAQVLHIQAAWTAL